MQPDAITNFVNLDKVSRCKLLGKQLAGANALGVGISPPTV